MNQEYIIEIPRYGGIEYICGGTYKIGGDRYARCSSILSEAKRYASERQALRAGERLAKKCTNLKGLWVVRID